MSDDFFGKLDKKLGESKEAKAKAHATKEDNALLLREISQQVGSIIERYSSERSKRGITPQFDVRETGISFKLRYKEGGYQSFFFGQTDGARGSLAFTKHFTSDDGKPYRAAPHDYFERDSWKLDEFEDAVKEIIRDYVFYADRHGGIA